MDNGSAAVGFIIIGLLIFLYLIPGIVASSRDHPQKGAIWVITIFVGWTFVGWVVALVWACTNSQRVIVERSLAPTPAPVARGAMTTADEIEQFAKLRASGVITDAEFEAKKRQLLGLSDGQGTATA